MDKLSLKTILKIKLPTTPKLLLSMPLFLMEQLSKNLSILIMLKLKKNKLLRKAPMLILPRLLLNNKMLLLLPLQSKLQLLLMMV